MENDDDVIFWAFLHFYHADKANATMHCAPVRFSPIVFRLASILLDGYEYGETVPELAEVEFHRGKYELDHGR